MQNREPRHSVVVPARLRISKGWTDATILNMSNRGLMLRVPVELERGHIFELRRGSHIVVARVVWSDGRRCGARAQGIIPVADLVLDKTAQHGVLQPAERRTRPRAADRSEASRQRGRKLEFFVAGAGVACAAFMAADFVFGTLAPPLALVQGALGSH